MVKCIKLNSKSPLIEKSPSELGGKSGPWQQKPSFAIAQSLDKVINAISSNNDQ